LSSTAFVTADRLSAVPEAIRIVRMNCLRTAAELIKDANTLPDRKLAMVMTAAEQLEQHVLRPPEDNVSNAPPRDKPEAKHDR